MKGGEALLRSLVRGGVEVCFMNAGTSEMHVVAALDAVGGLRAVLGLFEGVVTGCADGYGRMAERPAATLLHLGPGLGNGIANLHNARRAHTPVLNLVGDHATYHRGLDAPLESDIESLARPVSGWYRSCARREELVGDVKEAIAAAIGPPGCVATLVVPADLTWLKATTAAPESAGEIAQATRGVSEDVLCEVQAALESKAPCGLLLGGSALRRRGLLAAGRIAARCGAKLLSEPFPARLEQGAGVVAIERLAYFAELASAQLAGLAHLVLVGGRRPVSPFAYPDLESDLVPQDCVLHVLSGPGEQAPAVLEELAEKIGAPKSPSGIARLGRDGLPSGELSAAAAAGVIGALLPEEAIVSDESITAGIFLPAALGKAPPHDLLCNTGNAIGQGLPVASGAAVACPGRPVLALQADGSAMYTIQALWTQAREGLDVTTVLFDNGSYGILNIELDRLGLSSEVPLARSMLAIDRPSIDFAALSKAMGVPASLALSADDLVGQLGRALSEEGPHLVHAMIT